MGFSFLQFILSSDAQGCVLLHGIGVGVKDGLQHVGDELLHLLGCTAHFVAKERVDGKLILPEAVQILKMKAGSGS